MSAALLRCARCLPLPGRLGALWVVFAAAACQPAFNQPVAAPALDEPFFRCHVQRVLTRSCAMFACHGGDGRNGTGSRYFQVYAPNRLRLPSFAVTNLNMPLTAQERAANLAAASAMVDVADPAASYLLLKPLEQQSGGLFHRGAELYMQGNVFTDRQDPDFKVLQDWVNGAKESPSCVD